MPRPPFVSRLGERFRLGRPLASGARGFATLAAGLRFRQRRRPSPTIMYLAGDRLSITMADYPAKLSEADGGSFQTSGNFGAPIVTQPEQPPRPTWGGGRAPSDAVDLLLAFADLFVLNDVDALLKRAVELVLRPIGLVRAGIYLYDESGKAGQRLVALRGYGKVSFSLRKLHPPTWRDYPYAQLRPAPCEDLPSSRAATLARHQGRFGAIRGNSANPGCYTLRR